MKKVFRIFADGACRGNSKQSESPGGWGAIVLSPDEEVTELGGASASTTNNQMEMSAVGHALRLIEKEEGEVEIFTDSKYLIEGLTKWIHGWKKNGFQTKEDKPVANQKYWVRLDELLEQRKKSGLGSVKFTHIRGHAGIPGNERVDEIATAFADGKKISLYKGALKNYSVDLFLVEVDFLKEPFYLSLVSGSLKKHKTWQECSQRVQGAAGAKYKKCKSLLEARQTVKEWGLSEEVLNGLE